MNENRSITGKLNLNRPVPKTDKLAREIRAGALSGVIPKLIQAVAKNADDAVAWRNLVQAYNERREYKNALKAIARLERLRPASRGVRISKAMVLSNMSAFDKALPLLQKLHGEEPDNLVVLDGLKVGNFYQGDVRAALRFGGDALRLRDKNASDFARENKLAPIEHTFWNQEKRTAKIISYSLYGARRRYHLGAVVNVRLAKYFFPDWTCRMYLGDDVPQRVVADLQQSGAEVIFAGREYSEVPRYFWRFLVADDPKVEYFMVRDCDARPTPKDALGIAAWLDRGRPFHVFRDHVLHNMPIMAGMWGGRTDYTWNMAARIADYCRGGVNNIYGADQDFLMKHIWPLIRDKALVYDSYYKLGGSSNFPYFGKGTDRGHLGMGVVGNKLLRREAREFGLERPVRVVQAKSKQG